MRVQVECESALKIWRNVFFISDSGGAECGATFRAAASLVTTRTTAAVDGGMRAKKEDCGGDG